MLHSCVSFPFVSLVSVFTIANKDRDNKHDLWVWVLVGVVIISTA